MNANVVKLLLSLVLMSFLSSGQAYAGGLSQGISRGDISDDSSINDDEKGGEGERQTADSSDDQKQDGNISDETELTLDVLEDFLSQFSFLRF